MVFYLGIAPAYSIFVPVTADVKITGISEFSSSGIAGDCALKYQKSGHIILQRIAARARRKMYPSLFFVVLC